MSAYESYISALNTLQPEDVTSPFPHLHTDRTHRNGMHAFPPHLHRRTKSESIPEAKEDHFHED